MKFIHLIGISDCNTLSMRWISHHNKTSGIVGNNRGHVTVLYGNKMTSWRLGVDLYITNTNVYSTFIVFVNFI